MSHTATAPVPAGGLLPAFTPDQLASIAIRETARILDPDDREDAAQEFALGALIALSRAEPSRAIRAFQWAYGRGRVRNFLRLRRRLRSLYAVSLDLQPDAEDGPGITDMLASSGEAHPEAVERTDTDAWVRNTVDRLPPRMALLVRLRYFQNLTRVEIGQHLGITGERVRQLETSALAELRSLILDNQAWRERSATVQPAGDEHGQ